MSSTAAATIGLGLPLVAREVGVPIAIPNEKGEVVKIETVVFRDESGVRKFNVWMRPDDTDHRARPHNHPWRFKSTVHSGAITEVRYTPVYSDDGQGDIVGYRAETVTHKAGDTYICEADTYHVVVDVTPGTVTEMICEAVVNNPWGYLEVFGHTREDGLILGTHVPAVKDPSFLERMWTLNPLKRPTPK